MGYDPEGTWNWSKFWKTVGVVALAALVVTTVAVVTVTTGGTALPVLLGAIIGASSSGAISAIVQLTTTGSLDWGQLVVDMALGAVTGAFGGSTIGLVGMAIAGGATSFMGSVASDFVQGNEINIGKAIVSGIVGAAFGALTGGGSQHGKNAALKSLQSKTLTKSVAAQIKNQKNILTKNALNAMKPNSEFFSSMIIEWVTLTIINAL